MTLFTDQLFLTDDKEGFRICRETRTVSPEATMTVILCTAGYLDVFYHGEMIRIGKNDLFVRVPDFVEPLGPYVLSDDLQFMQVTIDSKIYKQIMYDHIRVEPNWYTKQEYVKQHPIFRLSETSRDFFKTYFHALTLQLQDRLSDYRRQIMMLMARCAVMEMLNYIDKMSLIAYSSTKRVSANASDYLFEEFMRSLHQNPHQREVQWHAKNLELTPKYLSEICKEISGRSAGEWIAEFTVAELKHYLCNTTIPIHDIATIMGFPNSSFFCQYTKKHTGLTPNHFRKASK